MLICSHVGHRDGTCSCSSDLCSIFIFQLGLGLSYDDKDEVLLIPQRAVDSAKSVPYGPHPCLKNLIGLRDAYIIPIVTFIWSHMWAGGAFTLASHLVCLFRLPQTWYIAKGVRSSFCVIFRSVVSNWLIFFLHCLVQHAYLTLIPAKTIQYNHVKIGFLCGRWRL